MARMGYEQREDGCFFCEHFTSFMDRHEDDEEDDDSGYCCLKDVFKDDDWHVTAEDTCEKFEDYRLKPFAVLVSPREAEPKDEDYPVVTTG